MLCFAGTPGPLTQVRPRSQFAERETQQAPAFEIQCVRGGRPKSGPWARTGEPRLSAGILLWLRRSLLLLAHFGRSAMSQLSLLSAPERTWIILKIVDVGCP